MTMKAAQDLGRKRWADATEEEKAEHAKMMSDARQAKLSPEQRSAAAKKAAQARWAKKEKPEKSAKERPVKKRTPKG